MGQPREALPQNLAERWCWQAARRDDRRVARRLYQPQGIAGGYRRDEGPVLDAFGHCLEELGVLARMAQVRGTAIERVRGPSGPYLLLYGLKPWLGMASMHALPPWLCSEEALRRVVGFNAHQVRHGVCPRGAATRPGPRTAGPICPQSLAPHLVQLKLRALEALCNGSIEAVAQVGVFERKVTGILAATDLETTAPYTDCGQVTRTRKVSDKPGQPHEGEVTVDGWQLSVVIAARPKLPLAAKVVKSHAHEVLWRRALVMQAQANLASYARLHTLGCAKGCLAGTALWWLDQQGRHCVGPATDNMAVSGDARAQAAAAEGMSRGRRGPTGRHGQGKTAWPERLATEVVGLTGLPTSDQDGTAAHGRHHNRRDCAPNPITAVVVRQWQGRDDGPGGKPVFLTNASVEQPLKPFDADDDRSLREHCCIKDAKPQGDLGHPPQKTGRAGRVHVVFTLLLVALAPAYRLQGEHAALGEEPVGWQRWRRQLLQQNRDKVMVFAQQVYGLFHGAEDSLLLGAQWKQRPPGIGTPQELLARYGLAAYG